MLKRIASLELRTNRDKGPDHVLLGTAETLPGQVDALKASSKWKEGDEIFMIELVGEDFKEESVG
ncbi:hypothetical protein [Microvirga pudoricolor]|uniref:hypothetical protein n=1 Tax=Microvirga pudoricolor TaxID=2778729 RepID=UPI0019501CBC|nr:hypothetical protein [Microvirga pudoricolor]MBM6593737.1 hypothetical protein [Microvirga pudoricolor]